MGASPDTYDVFVSYSRRDARRAAMVRDKLLAQGLRVFFDSEGIEGGAEFTDVLDRAVKTAKVVLACWTHEALERRWVRIESRIGLDRGTLIATALEPMAHSDLPAEFYNVNVVDLSTFEGQDDHPGWQGVLRSIGRNTGRADLASIAVSDAPLIGNVPSRPAPARAVDRRVLAAGLAAGLLVLGVGGWFAASQMGGGATASIEAPAALADRFDQQIRSAEPILRAGAEGRVAEIATQAYPRSIWATAQLVTVAPDIPDRTRGDYERVLATQLAGDCHCVVIDNAPLSVVSAWIVLSYAQAGRAAPPDALTGLLAGQNARGWWSSALDADDQASNASLYVTALVAFALGQAEPHLSGEDRLRVSEARRRAVTWLRTLRPSDNGLWSDYPDNAQRNEHPVFSAMMTIILLDGAEDAEAAQIASQYLNALSEISPPESNFSYDTLVTHHGGAPYVDTFRHLPMGWETHALALAYPHLQGAERARAAELLTQAASYPLDDPALARQEWIIAEAVFGLRYAAAALRTQAR